MGIKIPIRTLTITMIIFSFATLLPSFSAHATTFHSEWGELWSFDEAREVYLDAEAKKDLVCGVDDYFCRINYGYDLTMEDPKYSVAEFYSTNNFLITAVNPENNTLRVYYRDLDFMAMAMENMEVHLPLDELFIVWAEPGHPTYDGAYVTAFRNGAQTPGIHPIYIGATSVNGDGWFPVESEVEITSPDAHLDQNDRHIINYFANYRFSSTYGGIDYSTCVNAVNYRPGMECRLMFKNDYNFVYIPFEEPTTPEEPATFEEPIVQNAQIVQEDIEGNLSLIEDNLSMEEGYGEAPTLALTPDTGEFTPDEKQPVSDDKNDFSWGLFSVLGFCSIIVLWFMLPNHQKNFKKSIDKDMQSR